MKPQTMFANSKRTLVLVACLIFISLFLGLGAYDLTAPDEPRFALVALEMLTSGNWMMPHRNDQPYPDKPPLLFWSIASVAKIIGGEVNAWSARIPSAFAALGVLGLMFFWVKRKSKDDMSVAWLTVMVLLTTFRFVLNARSAQIDMLLCLCTTLSLVMGYAILNGGPDRSRLLGICLGLGILAKGPVGYLVPVGCWVVFCFFRSSFKDFPLKALLWGLLPPLIWLFFLNRQVLATVEWDYFNNLLFKQTLTRVVNPWHHHQPWYYFPVTYLHDGLPWSFVLLAAIPLSRPALGELTNQQRFAWATVVFTMFMFSLSAGKRSVYILPLYPFAAYLVASFITNDVPSDAQKWRLKVPLLLSGALLILVGVAVIGIAVGWLPLDLPPLMVEAMPTTTLILFGSLMCAVTLVCILAVVKSRIAHAVQALVLAMTVLHALFYMVALPFISPYRSARRFTETATALIRAHDPSPVVGMVVYRSAYRFYGEYPLVELCTQDGEPDPNLDNPKQFFHKHPNGWLIVRSHHWQPFEAELPKAEWLRMEVGRGEVFYLLGPHKEEVP